MKKTELWGGESFEPGPGPGLGQSSNVEQKDGRGPGDPQSCQPTLTELLRQQRVPRPCRVKPRLGCRLFCSLQPKGDLLWNLQELQTPLLPPIHFSKVFTGSYWHTSWRPS